jgi:hypothetical protein
MYEGINRHEYAFASDELIYKLHIKERIQLFYIDAHTHFQIASLDRVPSSFS